MMVETKEVEGIKTNIKNKETEAATKTTEELVTKEENNSSQAEEESEVIQDSAERKSSEEIQDGAENYPDIKKVTDEEKDLPYEERLKLLEQNAESLFEFCVNKGFSTNQLTECLSPLLGKSNSIIERIVSGSSRSFIILALVIGIIAVMVKVQVTRDLIGVHLRMLSVKTLNVYDWRTLYEEDCIVYNNYLEKRDMTKGECYGCIDFTSENKMDQLINANTTVITNDYLLADWPFIVTDATRDWPRDKAGKYTFSLDKIAELYETNGALLNQKGCDFVSTVDGITSVPEFFKALNDGQLSDMFHTVWNNCEPKAGKVFRYFTKRPYFFEAMAEAQPTNNIIVARGHMIGEWFPIPNDGSAVFLFVLSGEMVINIRPVEDCLKFGCKERSYPLRSGEAIVVPTRVYNLEYTANSEETVLAFSSSVLWDEVVGQDGDQLTESTDDIPPSLLV